VVRHQEDPAGGLRAAQDTHHVADGGHVDAARSGVVAGADSVLYPGVQPDLAEGADEIPDHSITGGAACDMALCGNALHVLEGAGGAEGPRRGVGRSGRRRLQRGDAPGGQAEEREDDGQPDRAGGTVGAAGRAASGGHGASSECRE
jgi:hypothetical protein